MYKYKYDDVRKIWYSIMATMAWEICEGHSPSNQAN